MHLVLFTQLKVQVNYPHIESEYKFHDSCQAQQGDSGQLYHEGRNPKLYLLDRTANFPPVYVVSRQSHGRLMENKEDQNGK